MKRGQKLSSDQVNKIITLVEQGLTDKEVAQEVKCTPLTVLKVRQRNNLVKHRTGVIQKNKIKLVKGGINHDSSKSDEEKARMWEISLRTSKRYVRLRSQFNESDLEYFVEQWVSYHMQLDDMTASEDDLLESLIVHNIRIIENQKKYRKTQEYEEELTKLLKGRQNQQLDLENENDRFIFEMIQSNNKSQQEINKELKDLRESYEKLHRMLNTTREQREARSKIGSDTFLHLVRLMQDRDRRQEIGRENELVRVATDRKIKYMKKPHKFSDGTEEALLLDGEDFISKDQNEKGGVSDGS
jgi:hypothetical protein